MGQAVLKRIQCPGAGRWWRTPLIPALGRQRQADLCEFEASLVYKSKFQDRHSKSYRETLSRKTKKKKRIQCPCNYFR